VGQIAFASDRSGVPEIYLVNIDGSDLVQLTDISEGACQPEWSPDGTRLVFISPCPKNQESYPGSSLFLIDADGGNLTPLPGAPGGDYDPSWSPYGGKIAFTSLRDGGMPQIYILSLVDNSVIELPDDTQRANYHPAWSPDGKLIAFIGGDNRIWAMSPDSTNRHSLSIGGADFKNMDPVWYPDGSALIFTRSTIDNESGITWLMAVQYQFSGALPVELGDSDYSSEVSISPDGFWIVFKSFITGTHDIYFMRFNGIDRQVLFNDAAYDFDPAWRPVENQP
jgi:Tol biopolymer transport system component